MMIFPALCSLYVPAVIMGLASGGASSSRQPGHCQVTKVVRQVIILLSLHFPFPALPLNVGPLKYS